MPICLYRPKWSYFRHFSTALFRFLLFYFLTHNDEFKTFLIWKFFKYYVSQSWKVWVYLTKLLRPFSSHSNFGHILDSYFVGIHSFSVLYRIVLHTLLLYAICSTWLCCVQKWLAFIVNQFTKVKIVIV